jgi:Arc/MetJ family transcription regulator
VHTKRAAINFALRALVGDRDRRDTLDFEGAGWEGDLEVMRGSPEALSRASCATSSIGAPILR